ncbi:ADP-ribosylation factor-like protein 6 [Styela clava]|uniref:ADP-ribosylation factor-like protein 6 n=1 Tax=Styela clava TaxID=7725 RepID=UPI001939C481|nr:ADP-ribosylation factor-like protein 6 [Styela clava]
MGFWGSLSKWLAGKKREARILCVGLDNSGKSTILDKFKPKKDQRMDTAATLGFSVEKFKFSNITFTAFDMSGQGRYRNLWEKYYSKCDAIIFVLDSSDRLRIPVAKEELNELLKHPSIAGKPNLPILFYANKCDIRNSMPAPKCAQLLGLNKGSWEGNDLDNESPDFRPWYICASNAQTGEGLNEGIKWISEKLVSPGKVNRLV